MSKWYEIFKAGNYEPQGDFGEQALDEIVRNYNPAQHEAPLVIGHPKMEDPAFGWVETIMRAGDKLLAKFKQIEPSFASMVNEGRFKNISVRLRKTDQGWTLRHVGFLGATAPAVVGLKPVQFSNEDGGLDIQCEFSSDQMKKEDKTMPLTPEERQAILDQAKAEARKELQTEFSQKETKLEQDLQTARNQLKLKEFASVIETNKTKLPPAVRSGLAEFMAGLSEEVSVEFAEQEGTATKQVKVSPLEFFKGFVAKLPEQVSFGETAGGGTEAARNPVKDKDFGASVDPERLELHRKVLDFAQRNKVPYEEALIEVTR